MGQNTLHFNDATGAVYLSDPAGGRCLIGVSGLGFHCKVEPRKPFKKTPPGEYRAVHNAFHHIYSGQADFAAAPVEIESGCLPFGAECRLIADPWFLSFLWSSGTDTLVIE